MSEPKFSWLHLTDLHVGLDESDWLWPGVEEEVLSDLARLHGALGPVDAVFFTGDLTQQGDGKEFARFDAIWGKIRRKLQALGSNPVFLAVPGNHDLVRPRSGAAVLDGLRLWKSEPELRKRFWTTDDGDYRRAVRTAFEPWTAWADRGIDWTKLKNVSRDGLLPGDFAATIEIGDRAIGVLGLNTAALQLAGGDFRGRLGVHPRQASQLVGSLYEWVQEHDACFLLTHHDPSWFDDDSVSAWNGEIARPGRFVAHFCGHRHQQGHTLVVEGGARARRTVVGRSLFGLETYEHEGGRRERLHGYSGGVITFGATRVMRLWPRRDELQQAGHRELRADQSVTLTPEGATAAEDIGNSPRRVVPAAKADLPTPAPIEGWIEITAHYLESCRRDLDVGALRLFYDGQEPGWSHALLGDDAIPRRDVVRQAVSRLQTPEAPTLVLLVAAGGEGKSLAVRQAVVDLVRAGHRILWRQDTGGLDPAAVARLSPGPWILASDDGEVIAGRLESALQALHRAERRDVRWLIGARDTDWRVQFRRGPRGGGEPMWSRWAAVWPPSDQARRAAFGLSEADAAKVVRAWDKAGSLGRLASIAPAERAKALVSSSRQSGQTANGTFFGAVLDERFGADGLLAHLETVLRRLGDVDHGLGTGCSLADAFLYAAAAEAVGIDGVDLKVVADLTGVDPDRRRTDILHRLGQEALAAGGGEALRTRAPAIARAAVQLVENGQVEGDLEVVFTRLVRATGELGRRGGVDVSHGAIMNCGPRLARELPKLGVEMERARRVARAAADEASRVEPALLVGRTTQARTYREIGDPRGGSRILRDAMSVPDSFLDWEECVRGAAYELGVCEGAVANLLANLWLAGLSVADGAGLGPITEERAKLSLAGLGAACLEIVKRGPLDEPFRNLLRATAVLGPRVTPGWDTKASGYFRRHRDQAERMRVPDFPEDDALGLVAEAVRHAGELVNDADLREVVARVWGSDPPSFRQLRRTLRLGTGPAGTRGAGGTPERPSRPENRPNAPAATPSRSAPPPEPTRATSMTTAPPDLIDVLAEEYPDVRDARSVWVRAGGRNGEVENISRPRDLWQNLWLRSVRGASVRPAALLKTVLEDLPHNTTVIAQLATLASSADSAAARHVIERIETSGTLDTADTLTLLAEWEVKDEADAFAAICPAMEGRLAPERRSELRETLTGIAGELRNGALEGVVKAGTSEAVKVLLAALAATAAAH